MKTRARWRAPFLVACGLSLPLSAVHAAAPTGDDDFPGRRIDTPGLATRVAIVGSLAYVADKSAGLQIVDISNAAAARIVGSVPTPDANGVTVAGNVAYVADGVFGMMCVDVRNPAAPALLAAPNHCMSLDVAVSGRYAHVAVYGGLQVFDVADPSAPAYIGDVDWETTARAVVVSGNYAYYACARRGVRIFDVTDPTRPALVREVDTPGVPQDLYVAGDHLFVADGSGGLQVVDITAPPAAAIVGRAPTRGPAHGVAVSGQRAYVAAGAEGLEVFDITNPTSPLGETNFTSPVQAGGVGVYGNDVVIANGAAGVVVLEQRAQSNIGPRCDAGGPYSGMTGQNIRFHGMRSRDPDGMLTTYFWEFGDGTRAEGPDAVHAYAQPGLYFARLCVADDYGIVSCCETPVELRATPVTLSVTALALDGRVRLEWEVAENIDLEGFLVHRRDGDVAAGAADAFTRLTPMPLPATRGVRGAYSFEDDSVAPERTYTYRIEAIEPDGARSFAERTVQTGIAGTRRLALHPAAPNPFKPQTTIAFDVPRPGPVRIAVFDVAGRRLRRLLDANLAPQRHAVVWDGRDDVGQPVAAGTYVVHLQSSGETLSRKLVLME